jgi:Uma2 family endonuclease
MSTSSRAREIPLSEYPTGDGKPVAETPLHRDQLLGLIEVLRRHFVGNPRVYISGNMMMYYERGNKRRHVSPDVFVVLDLPPGYRDAYFTWVEGKGPDLVVEFTSPSTRKEDLKTKYRLYQDTLGVSEYILFDPRAEYLDPRLQGHRLVGGRYEPIAPTPEGRLPSNVLNLHFEGHGTELRLYDPALGRWVPTPHESEAAAVARQHEAEESEAAAVARQHEAEESEAAAVARLRQAEAELERVRAELEAMRRRDGGMPGGA